MHQVGGPHTLEDWLLLCSSCPSALGFQLASQQAFGFLPVRAFLSHVCSLGTERIQRRRVGTEATYLLVSVARRHLSPWRLLRE